MFQTDGFSRDDVTSGHASETRVILMLCSLFTPQGSCSKSVVMHNACSSLHSLQSYDDMIEHQVLSCGFSILFSKFSFS